MSNSVANNQHLQLTRQLILHIFPAQKLRLTSLFRKKSKNILAQNCLKRMMSQLLEYTKKSRKKSKKLFLGKNFLKRIMIQLLNNTKRMTKIEEKKSRKIIFGSELSEAKNEPTLR